MASKMKLLGVLKCCINQYQGGEVYGKRFYYSTLAPFYHIRSRERAKYATVLCTALQNPGFTGFLAEGLEKPNFDVIFSSGIIKLLFDGLTYNTRGQIAHCSYFPSPLRGSEKCYATRAYYMLSHPIRCIHYTFSATILPPSLTFNLRL